jgi:arylsulfatase A-like enzyme
MEGKSLVPLITGNGSMEDRTLFREHKGHRAVRHGDWNLVSKHPDNIWKLYLTKEDRSEMNDHGRKHPELVVQLNEMYP